MKVDFSKSFSRLSRTGVSGSLPFFAALLGLLLVWPQDAMAQSLTLGELMCNMVDNITPFAWLMNGIAYIVGAVLIGNGLVLLIKYTDKPGEAKLHLAIMHMIAGAGLLFLPSTISLLINSLFGMPGSGGFTACIATLPSSGGIAGITLDGMMTNLVMNIKDPMVVLLSVISIVIGVYLIIRGLIKAAKFGYDPKTHSITNFLASLIVGTILVVVGQSLDVMLSSIFGVGGIADSSVVTYAIASNFGPNTQQFQMAVYAALTFFQLIGMIAFIRGFLILKSAVEGSGQATIAQGLTHIIGGVLAINIYYFLVVMDTTFGTGFLS
jgi:hypothetical protein